MKNGPKYFFKPAKTGSTPTTTRHHTRLRPYLPLLSWVSRVPQAPPLY
jgi:hypothetical protein